jgi:hypothetical protein
VNIWAYTALSAEEAADWVSRSFESDDDLTTRLLQVFEHASVVFALAADDELVMWDDARVDGDLKDRVAEFMNDALHQWRRLQSTPPPTFEPDDSLLGVA